MTDQERKELEQLKLHQAELQQQLANLGEKVAAFEKQLTEPSLEPIPTIAMPAIEPVPIEFVDPAPQLPPPPPPVIAPIVVPPPQPTVPQTAPQTTAPPVIPAFSTPLKSKMTTVDSLALPGKTPPAKPAAGQAAQPEPAGKGSFEMRLGTFWLVRIGVVLLITGLVFFGNFAYQNFITNFGPGGKVALCYGASAILLAAGTWCQRRDELKNFSQVLLAGGLAAVYFTTFAAHHVETLRIIASPLVDGALLLLWAGFTVWIADCRKSEVLALFAVLLAYYTSVITQVGLFTLYSNLVLTLTAVFFLIRNRWAALSFVSLAATYASYAFWRFFHDNQWHWAGPGEGLWTGNYFLIGDWVLFTAAVFLSRSGSFDGGRRTAFLSLNNIAFFTGFILTMLQVHQGGFWKFSLAYGGVLLGLTALARKVLPNDQPAANAYLTQGLLLVTLGFLNYYTGLKLSLVLAAESVALVTLGRQLKSRVMDIASLAAAALGILWSFHTIQPHDRDGLLLGSALGAAMIFNAFWLRRDASYEKSTLQPRTVLYTILGLAVWFYTTWQNAGDEWLGLILACESTVFLIAARPLVNKNLSIGALVFGVAATAFELYHLNEQYIQESRYGAPDPIGLLPAILLGVVLLFNALTERRLRPAQKDSDAFQTPVTLFSSLSLLCWLGTTFAFADRDCLAPSLAVEALLFTAAWHLLRIREITLFGQGFLIIAQSLWFYDFTLNHAARSWWNAVVVIVVTLAVARWWQRQKTLTFKEPVALMFQGVFAAAIVGVFFLWLLPHFTGPEWIAFTSLLAVSLTIYGALARFWLLVAAAQLLLLASGLEFGSLLWDGKPTWYFALTPIASLGLLSFATIKWLQARSETPSKFGRPVLQIARGYRVVAVAMSLWWVHKYIDSQEQCWGLGVIGLVLFAFAAWRANRETLLFSAVFTVGALCKIWLPPPSTVSAYWPNLLVILGLLAQQQFARRRIPGFKLSPTVQASVITVSGLTLWLFVSRWILEGPDKLYLTAAWSALALLMFVAGFSFRERAYRWLGLAVLGFSLGRVFIVDCWHWDTIYRVLSFMALGVVFIVLSFIYNRYQEKIREWL